MDRGIDGRAGAAGEEEGPVQKTESGKFKLTHYPRRNKLALLLPPVLQAACIRVANLVNCERDVRAPA